MANTITFTREQLDKFKEKVAKSKEQKATYFIWKGGIFTVLNAEELIRRLEASPNLQIKI